MKALQKYKHSLLEILDILKTEGEEKLRIPAGSSTQTVTKARDVSQALDDVGSDLNNLKSNWTKINSGPDEGAIAELQSSFNVSLQSLHKSFVTFAKESQSLTSEITLFSGILAEQKLELKEKLALEKASYDKYTKASKEIRESSDSKSYEVAAILNDSAATNSYSLLKKSMELIDFLENLFNEIINIESSVIDLLNLLNTMNNKIESTIAYKHKKEGTDNQTLANYYSKMIGDEMKDITALELN